MNGRACPACNVELVTDEAYDGYVGINEREEEWYGHCSQCGQYYHWTEVYVYKETKNFEVYTEEEDG